MVFERSFYPNPFNGIGCQSFNFLIKTYLFFHRSFFTFLEVNDEEKSMITCEKCHVEMKKSSLLKHIGHMTECKKYYGSRFDEMKKARKTKTKHSLTSHPGLRAMGL